MLIGFHDYHPSHDCILLNNRNLTDLQLDLLVYRIPATPKYNQLSLSRLSGLLRYVLTLIASGGGSTYVMRRSHLGSPRGLGYDHPGRATVKRALTLSPVMGRFFDALAGRNGLVRHRSFRLS